MARSRLVARRGDLSDLSAQLSGLSNGDGIGDLRASPQRLPHIASLGVDAIWISPVLHLADEGFRL
jgi:glycosidase